jgi:hypothetical protein
MNVSAYIHLGATRAAVKGHTSKGKLGSRVSARLVVSNEAQDLAEASHGQETAVLRVCNLPYFTQYGWC